MGRYSSIALNTTKRYLSGINKGHNIKHLTFEVTNLCNSKCEMCHIWANKQSPNELTTEEIIRFFNDESLKNLKDVIITGGEAFLRDDIYEIVKAIWSINQQTSITLSTNGILYDKILSVAEKIYKDNIPVTYGISLDGIGEDHNSRRRVENNFEIISDHLIPGLKNLSKDSPGLINIGIGHCLDDYGSKTFKDVQNFCKSNNIGFMTQLIEDFDYYLPEKKQNKTNGNWHEIHFQKIGFDGKNRLLKKDLYSDKAKYREMLESLPNTVHHRRLINVINGTNSTYECSSFRNFFLLKYDGEVTPCLRFSTKSLGNIKLKSIKDILNLSEREIAVDEILKCEGCLNTWCTDWSMEENALPFRNEVKDWALNKIF